MKNNVYLYKIYKKLNMKQIYIVAALLISSFSLFAQVGIGTNIPDASAILDLTSTDKGFLLPRLSTADRDMVNNPAEGLWIYNTTEKCVQLALGTGTGAAHWSDCLGAATTPPAPTVFTASLTGRTCFDVAESNNGGAFGALSDRSKVNFATTPTFTYTYTNTAAATNVSFSFLNTNGTPIASVSPSTPTANVAANANLTMTATFATGLNATAASMSEADALTAELYVDYTVGTTTFRKKVTVNVRDSQCCRVLIAPGVYKDFLCHNLGADTSLDPHDMTQTNVWGLNGAYIQWGKRGPAGDARSTWVNATNDGANGFAAAPTSSARIANGVASWSTTAAADDAWLTDNGDKTANDPCPSGYRVPTIAEWEAVNTNNTPFQTGPWDNNHPNHYSSALYYGPDASTKLLTLPAAGYLANSLNSVDFTGIGFFGYYWSSTQEENTIRVYSMFFRSNDISTSDSSGRTSGHPVRCIAE